MENHELQNNLEHHITEDKEFHKAVLDRLDEMDRKLEPIIDVYKALLFNRSFIMGLGSVITAITIIGSAIWWLIHRP